MFKLTTYSCIVFSTFLLLASCKSEISSISQSTPTGSQTPNETVSLFKDKMDFNLEGVKRGKICGSIKSDKIKFTYHVWPGDIQRFLAQELSRFEYLTMVAPHVQGFYLVDFNPNVAIGMTCFNTETQKYVIFISTSIILNQRDNSQIDVASYKTDARSRGIPLVKSKGDQAIQTLIHELFHVIDMVYYFDNFIALLSKSTPKDAAKGQARLNFFELVWRTDVESHFDGVLPSLAASTTDKDQKLGMNLAEA